MTNSQQYQAELLQERLGLKIAARLADASNALPHEITERLRHARVLALSKRKLPRTEPAVVLLYSGAGAVLGGSQNPAPWWQRAGLALPALALLLGLVAIDSALDDRVATEIAKLDAALLMDDLPPAAYADPGFSQFLKLHSAPSQ